MILGTAEGRILCVPVVQAHCEVNERQLQVYLTCIKIFLTSPSCSLCSRGQTHAHKNMTMVDRCGELGSGSQLDTLHKCHTHTHMHTRCCESQEWAFSQAVAKQWRMQPSGSESDETGPVESIVSPRARGSWSAYSWNSQADLLATDRLHTKQVQKARATRQVCETG